MKLEYCLDERELEDSAAWGEYESDRYFIEGAAEELVEEIHIKSGEYPDEDTIFLRQLGETIWKKFKVYAETEIVYRARFCGNIVG